MGVVFKATDVELDEVVAIKVLSPGLTADAAETLARFKREINLNRKIKHPNVARIHDFGTSGDYPYVTMEFVPGVDLKTLLARERRLDPSRAIPILRQIALGTDAAHRLGIIHRDLKSQNVVVSENGAVAILDFGLARGQISEALTLQNMMVGTPQYMSPEQALGRPADARSDVYSIGVIAFELLTGGLPFLADSPVALGLKHLNEPVPSDLERFSDVSSELRAIVLRALAKNPADRFQTAAELEAELEVELVVLRLANPPAVPAPPVLLPPTPVRAATPPPRELSGARTVIRVRPPVVLVADPSVASRLALARFLVSIPWKVHEAATGPDALEMAMEKALDLAVVDTTLPGMDGFDVVRIIRMNPELSALPVVLLAPQLERNQYAFGLQSGATDFLSKALTPAATAFRLWRILKHRGFQSEATEKALQEAMKNAPPEATGTLRPLKR